MLEGYRRAVYARRPEGGRVNHLRRPRSEAVPVLSARNTARESESTVTGVQYAPTATAAATAAGAAASGVARSASDVHSSVLASIVASPRTSANTPATDKAVSAANNSQSKGDVTKPPTSVTCRQHTSSVKGKHKQRRKKERKKERKKKNERKRREGRWGGALLDQGHYSNKQLSVCQSMSLFLM